MTRREKKAERERMAVIKSCDDARSAGTLNVIHADGMCLRHTLCVLCAIREDHHALQLFVKGLFWGKNG